MEVPFLIPEVEVGSKILWDLSQPHRILNIEEIIYRSPPSDGDISTNVIAKIDDQGHPYLTLNKRRFGWTCRCLCENYDQARRSVP